MAKDTIKVQDIPLVKINVGVRRRDDYGDMDGFINGIERNGLLHPITVDLEYNLIAGGRRLQAFQRLGRATIPCVVRGKMSESERRVLELEENRQRKNFTEYEDAKTLVELAEQSAAELNFELLGSSAPKVRHRSTKAASKEAVVKRIKEKTGVAVSRRTLARAEKRVAVVEQNPTLAGASQSQTLAEPRQPALQLSGAAYERMDALVRDHGFYTRSRAVESALEALLNSLTTSVESKPEVRASVKATVPLVLEQDRTKGLVKGAYYCAKCFRMLPLERASTARLKNPCNTSGCRGLFVQA